MVTKKVFLSLTTRLCIIINANYYTFNCDIYKKMHYKDGGGGGPHGAS
jgi:hypothetical protein